MLPELTGATFGFITRSEIASPAFCCSAQALKWHLLHFTQRWLSTHAIYARMRQSVPNLRRWGIPSSSICLWVLWIEESCVRLGPGIKAAGWPRPRYGGLTGDECCGLPRVRRVARSGNQRGPEDAWVGPARNTRGLWQCVLWRLAKSWGALRGRRTKGQRSWSCRYRGQVGGAVVGLSGRGMPGLFTYWMHLGQNSAWCKWSFWTKNIQ